MKKPFLKKGSILAGIGICALSLSFAFYPNTPWLSCGVAIPYFESYIEKVFGPTSCLSDSPIIYQLEIVLADFFGGFGMILFGVMW